MHRPQKKAALSGLVSKTKILMLSPVPHRRPFCVLQLHRYYVHTPLSHFRPLPPTPNKKTAREDSCCPCPVTQVARGPRAQ
eukprot:6622383-Alexandrium_andersonii.AAC.1